jgi:phosphoribosylglycinamide formyltransferase-1
MIPTAESERIAWLTSARDQAAVDLLEAILVAGIRPKMVLCCPEPHNREFVEQTNDLCRTADVCHLVFDGGKGGTHAELLAHDDNLWSALSPYHCTTLFLVGYMRFVTSVLLSKAHVINLHPATPSGPVGKWEDVVWSLIRDEATETGGMLHIATENVDRGPVISYYTVPIPKNDPELAPHWLNLANKLRTRSLEDISRDEGIHEPLFAAIRKRQFEREAPLLIVTLQQLLKRWLRIVKEGVVIDGELVPDGICLNKEVDALLRQQQGMT